MIARPRSCSRLTTAWWHRENPPSDEQVFGHARSGRRTLVQAPGSRTGSRFGPYELRSMLGKGGMGEVYEAYDTGKDRVVALKLLAPELAQDPAYQVRFRRESQAAAKLAEPHVIPIHDWGVIDGVLFIDMRLVPGTDLRTVLQAGGPLSPDRAVAVVEQIAAALDAAHAGGLVHRDVKPANILVTPADFAYLADFGIAHTEGDSAVTQAGMAMGSYIYMAPERFDVGPISNRADVYSLACVLHECLTGASPFPAASMSVLVRAHLSEIPPRPSEVTPGLPVTLDEVIARGMAKDPAERFASAGALAVAARQALAAAVQDAPPMRAAGTGGAVSGPVGYGPAGTPFSAPGAVPVTGGVVSAPVSGRGPATSGAIPVAGGAVSGPVRGSAASGAVPVAGGVPSGGRGPGASGPIPVAGGSASGPVGGRGPATSGAIPVAGGVVSGPGGVPGGKASATGSRPAGPGRDAGETLRAAPGGPARGGARGADPARNTPAGATTGGRKVPGEDAPEQAPTPTGEFRVVGAVTATGGIETSRSQTTATGAQPTLIIRPPAAAGAPETAGFHRVPVEGTGEVSIPAVIQPTGPAEIRAADTHFTPLPSADAPPAPEPPPAYTPDQGLPKMRPFPDAHLYENATPGAPSSPQPPFPAPTGFAPDPGHTPPRLDPPSGPIPQRGAPTQRFAGDPADMSPAGPGASGPVPFGGAPTQRFGGDPADVSSPGPGTSGPVPLRGAPTQRFAGDPDEVSPAGPGASGPVPFGGAPTQRFAGDPADVPLSGASGPVPLRGAPPQRFGGDPADLDPAGHGTSGPVPFGGAPTQRFAGDPADVPLPGASGPVPLRGAPTPHFAGESADVFQSGHGGSGPVPLRGAPTQRFDGAEDPASFSEPNSHFAPTSQFGGDSASPDGRFGSAPDSFGDASSDSDARQWFGDAEAGSDPRFPSPAGGFGDSAGPSPFGSEGIHAGPNPRFGSAASGSGNQSNDPAARSAATQKFDGARSGPVPRLGGPADDFDGPNSAATQMFSSERASSDDFDGPNSAATQMFSGEQATSDRFDDDDRFAAPTEQVGKAQRSAATQVYRGGPEAQFGPPTEQYDPAGSDPQRAAATQMYGSGKPDGLFGPPTEQYDPVVDPQRSAPTQHYPGEPDPQRAQATRQYRGGAAPFPAHMAPAGDRFDDPGAYSQYDDPNAAYGDHAYRDPAYAQDPYGPDPAYADPARQHQDSRPRRSFLLPVLVGVLAVMVLAIGGAIGWRLMSSADSEQTAAATSAVVPTGSGGAAPTTAPRATTAAPTTSAGPVSLPAGAQPCESAGATGAFAKSAVGSTVTSCGFAEAVRAAYASGGTSTAPRPVVATSPVTGRTYTMNCAPEGKLVTCTGGENAVVYVY
ncbi:protein kinase domain-containing protein [Nocardia asteroides]|uniref:protein kinase domain-containing protein n=1 Tax=Nocardia asteroides TaxID=1824 RepID=UPI003662CE5D